VSRLTLGKSRGVGVLDVFNPYIKSYKIMFWVVSLSLRYTWPYVRQAMLGVKPTVSRRKIVGYRNLESFGGAQ